jgi:hypothetical protein
LFLLEITKNEQESFRSYIYDSDIENNVEYIGQQNTQDNKQTQIRKYVLILDIDFFNNQFFFTSV